MRKQLLGSQIKILQTAHLQFLQAQREFQATVSMIMDEQNISEQERNLWKFSAEGKFLEKTEQPKMTIPKKKKEEKGKMTLNIVADELEIDKEKEKWKLDKKLEHFVKQ